MCGLQESMCKLLRAKCQIERKYRIVNMSWFRHQMTVKYISLRSCLLQYKYAKREIMCGSIKIFTPMVVSVPLGESPDRVKI